MSDLRRPDHPESGVDRDLSLKGVTWFSVGLTLALVGAAAAMWWISIGLRGDLAQNDRPPSVIPEARAAYQPPGPQLQEDPEAELVELRAAEEAVLSGYQWVDESTGIAQIPVERAIAILAAEAAEAQPAAQKDDQQAAPESDTGGDG